MLCKKDCKFLKNDVCSICNIDIEIISANIVADILDYLVYDASWDKFDYVKTMCGGLK